MGEIGHSSNRLVKVDNWGIFFLQRLHHFYRKNDHCDLTLQFSTLNTIKSVKVHRLVLYACTDYFESLNIMSDAEHGEFLQLSNEMHPDVVIPIISFMYTGKLEFPVNLQSKLYEAAIKLRMTILTKLLDAQPKTSQANQSDESFPKLVAFQHAEGPLEYSNNFDNSQDSEDSFTPTVQVTQIPMNSNNMSSVKHEEEPIVTLTPVTKTSAIQKPSSLKPDVKCVPRSVSSEALPQKTGGVVKVLKVMKKDLNTHSPSSLKTKVGDLSLPPTLPGRKLPVWKRKVPFTGSQSFSEASEAREVTRISESPRPTRFEWEEDLNDPTDIKPVEDALRVLSHDFGPEMLHPLVLDDDSHLKRETSTPISLSPSSSSSTSTGVSIPPSPSISESSKRLSPPSPDSPPYKKSKNDLQDMKEYGKQQQLRNEILCNEDSDDNDDTMDNDDIYGNCNDESQDATSPSVNFATPKPILKVARPEPSPLASKRVRFSLEGKENNEQPAEVTEDFTAVKESDSAAGKKKIVIPMDMNQIRTGGNHAKIVSEVLKKYPNLVRHNKNVKLKIMTKSTAAIPTTVQQAVEGDAGGGNKLSRPKVSYIYLKNDNVGQFPVHNVHNVPKEVDGSFDVENRTGPWLCNTCGTDAGPMEFESYYMYRKHLVDDHGIKVDSRICEYCGIRNSKRNIALYHLYTKHGIEPPARVKFPKCSDCDHVALSEALLCKHKAAHGVKEALTCYICNVVFKSFSAMQCHLESSLHIRQAAQRREKQIYRCPYCEIPYTSGDSLGKHIMEAHWVKKEEENESGNENDLFELQSGQQLQYQEETEVDPLSVVDNQPSSELESLSNVASGIATSLNLVGNEQTVVYYEHQSESQDIGGEATIITGDDCRDYLIPDSVDDVSTNEQYETIESNENANVENEDSDSRTSHTEEMNPISRSDHDYSEPQNEDTIRQVIPLQSVQSVAGTYPGNQPIIQTILPDQRLVFSTQPNVVFQPSRLNMPQRVLLAPGNMVLSQIAHPGQNVILSQVIPQTRIILSNPLLQQSGNIIQDPNNAIVFANPEITDQMQSMQPVQYPLQEMETEKQPTEVSSENDVIMEEGEIEDELEDQVEDKSILQQDQIPQEQLQLQQHPHHQIESDQQLKEPMETEEAGDEEELSQQLTLEQTDVEANPDVADHMKPDQEDSLSEEQQQQQLEQDNEQEQMQELESEQEVEQEPNEEQNLNIEEIQRNEENSQQEALMKHEESDLVNSNLENTSTNVEDSNETSIEGGEEMQIMEETEPEGSISILNKNKDDSRASVRLEPSKIVDDWDESNENQQNVESRSDGPSRPDFF